MKKWNKHQKLRNFLDENEIHYDVSSEDELEFEFQGQTYDTRHLENEDHLIEELGGKI